MQEYKTCSFFGHRKIEVSDEFRRKVKDVIEDLITRRNVRTFLFGSRSEFDTLCHLVVTELKGKYPEIKRICYTCRHEVCTLESEREMMEKVYSKVAKKDVHLLGFEEEAYYAARLVSGKASYVERNYAMIDDSDFCVFYYNENYQPEKRKRFKRSVSYYQPKSGTRLAYNYAKQKKKTILNVF